MLLIIFVQKICIKEKSKNTHCTNNFTEMPTTTEYINQHFKLKMFIKLNRRVLVKLCEKYYQFKILVSIFRKILRFNKMNIFSLKNWLMYSVVVGVSNFRSELHSTIYLTDHSCQISSYNRKTTHQ